MANAPRAGLLPLYLELYDNRLPEMRTKLTPFLDQVATGLQSKGVEVTRGEVCRLRPEVDQALDLFDQDDVDLIIVLHLAYSPSLETAGALIRSQRPLLLLDTTMDYAFGPDVDPDRILYNHGIHGLQDLASVLRRKKRSYRIVAGHATVSDVLDRAAGMARAAQAARLFKSARVLRIGESFRGMGDFAADDAVLYEQLGITVANATAKDLAKEGAAVADADVAAEMAADAESFTLDLDNEVHRRSVRAGLALRRVLEEGAYTAFSMNFLAFTSSKEPISTVPFLEASKAMGRGVGYAGEGDTLTAALVGALAASFGRTTFTEIFCPDWKGDRLFLSHMGEVNPELALEPVRMIEKDFPWTDALNPAVLAGSLAPSPAALVNLAPGPDDSFGLIVAPGALVGGPENPALGDAIRGWFAPEWPDIADFLEDYSKSGGTHHSALVAGDKGDALEAFAEFAGLTLTLLQ